MLLVTCPRCHAVQKTAPRSVLKAVKRCVYCNRSFKVHSGPEDSRIVPARPVLEGFREEL